MRTKCGEGEGRLRVGVERREWEAEMEQLVMGHEEEKKQIRIRCEGERAWMGMQIGD